MKDLLNIFKNMPQGTKLYSPLVGEVTFSSCNSIDPEFPLVFNKENRSSLFLTKYGRYWDTDCGECMIFPSKECRTWENYKQDLPEWTYVYCTTFKGDIGIHNLTIRRYRANGETYAHNDDHMISMIKWEHIIPIDKVKFVGGYVNFSEKDDYANFNKK